jgi:hypothetical protein
MSELEYVNIKAYCPECDQECRSSVSFANTQKQTKKTRIVYRLYCFTCKAEYIMYKIKPNLTVIEPYDMLNNNYMDLRFNYKK